MATSQARASVDISLLSGSFDLDSVPVYNIINVGHFIINNFDNGCNFCVQLKLLKISRSCPKCHHNLKLSLEHRQDHRTPVVFCALISLAGKIIFQFIMGHCLRTQIYHLNKYRCLHICFVSM